MDRIDLGETFVCVVDCGSLVRAAKRLRLTTAAVSKKISRLEDHLSTQLLDRGRKGVTPTEAGQLYYHQVKELIEKFREFESSFLRSEQEVKGKIKVVANRFYIQSFILPKLSLFLDRYPKIEIELDCVETVPDFDERKADIILGISLPSVQENVMRIKIGSTRYVLCGSPKYFHLAGQPQVPAELLKHNFLMHGSRLLQDRIYLDNGEEIRIKKRMSINDTDLLLQAAIEGLGLVWTHENLASKLIQNQKLIPVLNNYLKTIHSIYLYYPAQKKQSPAIQAFIQFFR
jgi:DNA-binding transcriptional LysR family regulator